MSDTHNITQLLATSRITIDIPVAWGEMDALSHVNNVVYFRYLESSRVAFIHSLGATNIRSFGDVGFILQHVECRFRRPVTYPDTLRITARLVNILEDRFTLTHAIISTAQNTVAAIGQGTIVTYDYAKATKVSIPEGVRRALSAHVGE
jgi:acyl-CoA thioester hydrolase